jgi:hypothetical protein
MEDQNKLSLNDLAISALRESGKWCMFLSIVGFIFIVFMLLFGVYMSLISAILPTPEMGGTNELGFGVSVFASIKSYFGILYLLMALLYFFPIYYLYNYAKGIKVALSSGNENILEKALVNLKSHHKFIGIMTIVMISLYVLFFIGTIIFVVDMASGGM